MPYYSQCRAILVGLYATLALLLSPVIASAGPITLFTDRDAFLAAANANTLLTFDDPAFCFFEPSISPFGGCHADFGDVNIIYPERPAFLVDEVVPVGPQNAVGVALPANTHAVGVDVLLAGSAFFIIDFHCGLSLSDFTVCESARLMSPIGQNVSTFFGVVAADESVVFPAFTASSGGPGIISIDPVAGALLDNLVMQVPEPATALLLSVGAMVLLQSRRFMRAKYIERKQQAYSVFFLGNPLFLVLAFVTLVMSWCALQIRKGVRNCPNSSLITTGSADTIRHLLQEVAFHALYGLAPASRQSNRFRVVLAHNRYRAHCPVPLFSRSCYPRRRMREATSF